ncbi:hypothetical protein EWH99_05760 [Sporolactobacillus sp. THM7-7]|nr:hypothetical protein EWH99_05760 [Sporolactobacillus sp. THM7-7]
MTNESGMYRFRFQKNFKEVGCHIQQLNKIRDGETVKKGTKSVVAVLLFFSLFFGTLNGPVGHTAAAQSTYKARITADVLNVRSGPGIGYGRVGLLHKNNEVTVVGTSHGWYEVKFGKKAGYISAKYAKKIASPKTSSTPASKAQRVLFTGYLTKKHAVRTGPSERYRSIATLQKGAAVQVLQTGKWYMVRYMGSTRYVYGDISKSRPVLYTAYVTKKHAVRTGPSVKYRSIATLQKGAAVQVLQTGKWYMVRYMGSTRYVYGDISKSRPVLYTAYVTKKHAVRTGPSVKYRSIATLQKGAAVQVLQEGKWYMVRYMGSTRYVYGDISKSRPVLYTAYVTKKHAVRTGPSVKYRSIATLQKGAAVQVLQEGKWYTVRYMGSTRYVYGDISKSRPASPQPEQPSDPPANSGSDNQSQPQQNSDGQQSADNQQGSNGNQQDANTGQQGQTEPVSGNGGQPAPQPIPNTGGQTEPQQTSNDGQQDANTGGNQNQSQPQQDANQQDPDGQQTNPDPGFISYAAFAGYDNLKVYSGPGTNYSLVITVREKTPVQVIDKSGNYLKINVNGTTGYVSAGSIEKDPNRFNPPSGTKRGVDVSHHKGPVDFNAVKQDGYSFVIIKASEGSTITDSRFASNAQGASAAGLAVHAYHFFRSADPNQARAEANHFSQVLWDAGYNGNNFGYLFVDVETTNGVDREKLTDNVNAFLDQMKANGFYKLGIYSGKQFYQSHLNSERFEPGLLVWIARYRGMDTNEGLGMQADIWQFSSNGSVNGIIGPADVNVSYSDKF